MSRILLRRKWPFLALPLLIKLTEKSCLAAEAEYYDEHVCLSASISPELRIQSLQNCCACYGRGSVLLWRRCDTLCTSGFKDDVVFPRDGQD